MTTFIASNGVVIRAHPDAINVGGDWIDRPAAVAIHEFLCGETAAAKPQPWKLAKVGDVWLLTDKRGETRPWTKLQNGEWGAFECGRHCILTNDHFVTGNALWASAPAATSPE
ncbi:hypothetical protein [Azospirillum tabaci]|uniref:hypothetical protein n=1 Tax=Azospirillum tabaci TaxID=2752310 RepID=UPI0016616655|nr:hypothetical protein [Azospirillum tabaci]